MYGATLLIVQFVIPLTIIIICYTAISLRIGQVSDRARKKERETFLVEHSSEGSKERQSDCGCSH